MTVTHVLAELGPLCVSLAFIGTVLTLAYHMPDWHGEEYGLTAQPDNPLLRLLHLLGDR